MQDYPDISVEVSKETSSRPRPLSPLNRCSTKSNPV